MKASGIPIVEGLEVQKVASLARGFYGNPGGGVVWGQQRFQAAGQALGQKWLPQMIIFRGNRQSS